MKKKSKIILGGCIVVAALIGLSVWNTWFSPTKIAFINFQTIQQGSISKANDNSFIKLSEVSLDNLDRLTSYDMVFINGMGLRKVGNFLEEIDFPEPKFLIVGNPEKLALLEKEIAEHLKGVMSVYRSEPFFLELLPLGIDKADCLDAFLKQIGYSQEDLMACGDGYNDLSMIRYAGMGVAMKNAQKEVLEAADYVTLSNDEDGVAEAVERILLLEEA